MVSLGAGNLGVGNLDERKIAYIRTFGCVQNESDSEKLAGILSDMGYEFTQNCEEASVIVFNTCAIRENAENRLFGNIGALKNQKKKNPNLIICICGCMSEQSHIPNIIKEKYKHVDIVLGTHALHKFGHILTQALERRTSIFGVSCEKDTIVENLPIRRSGLSAKVPIMYGCDNFCTYCIVPYVRGRERSRKPENIINEINILSRSNCKEVTLLGQNVNSYKADKYAGDPFAHLLAQISQIDRIERIRFLTSHPKDVSVELLETMSSNSKICKQLHLPVQSGSNKILEAMNRKYTRERYIKIIKDARSMMPELTISSDIIIGFPGETADDFEETLEILREIEFDTVFSFIYSKREGTAAAKMHDTMTPDQKRQNFNKLIEVQNEISLKKNKKYIGTTQEVLTTGPSKTNRDALTGRTDGGKIVNFKGSKELIGQIINLKIVDANTWTLKGLLLDS